ncbi:MAG: hypothetical protein M1837_000864 [Sclerophora amabilis]|nr:MAG: hypothetical protein M1837_000864 [Sclerophora amabilis]
MLQQVLLSILAIAVPALARRPAANSSFQQDTTVKYEVHNLPDANYSLPHSYAGGLGIPRKPGNSLFFWLFEAEDTAHSDDLILWISGGPGCSSLNTATINGPIAFSQTSDTPEENPFSWTKLANVLFIDQPIGTGYSFGKDSADDNEEVTEDFYSWLKEFYTVFPELKEKRTIIAGESYAGIYLNRILKTPQELSINLQAVSIGDPTIGSAATTFDFGIASFLNESSQVLKIPQNISDAFAQADRECGMDEVLAQVTYPPKGKISVPKDLEHLNVRSRENQIGTSSCEVIPTTPELVQKSIKDCYGGCSTFGTANVYLHTIDPCFNNYNINYTCTTAPNATNFSGWYNRPDVREAIHAKNKTFEVCSTTVLETLAREIVVPPTDNILPRILQKMPVHIYSGTYDFQVNHIGTELAIQNMTWNGAQGFHCKPQTAFVVDNEEVGTWGRERQLSYYLFKEAGHSVPHDKPATTFTLMRDYILGDSKGRHIENLDPHHLQSTVGATKI